MPNYHVLVKSFSPMSRCLWSLSPSQVHPCWWTGPGWWCPACPHSTHPPRGPSWQRQTVTCRDNRSTRLSYPVNRWVTALGFFSILPLPFFRFAILPLPLSFNKFHVMNILERCFWCHLSYRGRKEDINNRGLPYTNKATTFQNRGEITQENS